MNFLIKGLPQRLIFIAVLIAAALGSHAFAVQDGFRADLEHSIRKGCSRAGQPYFFDHQGVPTAQKTGILLVHGYTANPADTIILGRYLYQKGYTVYGVRLEGHGTTPSDLKRTNWQDWYASLERAYLYLRPKVASIHCIGISMGGLLTLELAAREELNSIVLLAPALEPRDKKAFLTRFFVPVADLLHIDLGYITVAQTAENKDHFYGKNPVRTVYQLVKLICHVKPRISKVSEPVLIMQDKNDTSASASGATYILSHVASEKKQLVFHDKGHVFTDRYEPALFRMIADIIARTR